MITNQRVRSDIATMERRETADNLKKDNRDKNDELTTERRFDVDNGETAKKTMRNSRDKNDYSTREKRFEEDKVIEKNRIRNDEATAIRREVKDEKNRMHEALAVFLFAVLVLEVVIIIGLV